MPHQFSSGRKINIAASRRGGLFAQERRWLQICGNCGHTKMAHKKVAHASKRQTGPCKEDMKTGFTCPCKEFLK